MRSILWLLDTLITLYVYILIASAILSARADCRDWDFRIDPFDLTGRPDDIVREIALVHHDDGDGATFQQRGEIALHPRQVEVATQRRHDEDDIDIRREQLRPGFAPA